MWEAKVSAGDTSIDLQLPSLQHLLSVPHSLSLHLLQEASAVPPAVPSSSVLLRAFGSAQAACESQLILHLLCLHPVHGTSSSVAVNCLIFTHPISLVRKLRVREVE